MSTEKFPDHRESIENLSTSSSSPIKQPEYMSNVGNLERWLPRKDSLRGDARANGHPNNGSRSYRQKSTE
ncbi:hypothetical protein BGT96224_1560 [Blumeria graminis f. sp. tritici 96224]|uniref:Uncharacterized protein n=1 Tax=Blumeria graminis f. sp. tritici 96224 TaxID=1268274 RepID=A0A656KKA4_BLUGR|nr:hypothetical protein BGT96224_1560 [Blumeria graminis f. sp. tritici 96224]